jgi:hypothetical protein
VFEHQLSFESLPRIWKRMVAFVVWVVCYGILLFALCYTYDQGISLL